MKIALVFTGLILTCTLLPGELFAQETGVDSLQRPGNDSSFQERKEDLWLSSLDTTRLVFYSEKSIGFDSIQLLDIENRMHTFPNYDPSTRDSRLRLSTGPKGSSFFPFTNEQKAFAPFYSGWNDLKCEDFNSLNARYLLSNDPVLEASFFRSSKNQDDELGYSVLHGQRIGHQWYYTAGLNRIGANGFYSGQASFNNEFYFRSSFQGLQDKHRMFIGIRSSRQNQEQNGGVVGLPIPGIPRSAEPTSFNGSSSDHRVLNLHFSHYWKPQKSSSLSFFERVEAFRHRYRYTEDAIVMNYYSNTFAESGMALDSTTLQNIRFSLGLQNPGSGKHSFSAALNYHFLQWETASVNAFTQTIKQVSTILPGTNDPAYSSLSNQTGIDPGFSNYGNGSGEKSSIQIEEEINVSGEAQFPIESLKRTRTDLMHFGADHVYRANDQIRTLTNVSVVFDPNSDIAYQLKTGFERKGLNSSNELTVILDHQQRAVPLLFRNYGGIHSRWSGNEIEPEVESRLSLNFALGSIKIAAALSTTSEKNYLDTNLLPANYNGRFNQLLLSLSYDESLWNFLGLKGRLSYSFSEDLDFFGIPALSSFSNIYLFRNLKRGYSLALGTELLASSAFSRPFYDPSIDAIAIPRGDREDFGPRLNPYFSLQVSDVQLMIKMENASQGIWNDRDFLLAAHPLADRVLRFGAKWTFFD